MHSIWSSIRLSRLAYCLLPVACCLFPLGGCTSGEWLVPGGGSHIKFMKAQKGDVIMDFYCNKDTAAKAIRFDAVKGTASVEDWSGNGSNLAVQQQIAVAKQIEANAKFTEQLLQLLQGYIAAGGAGGLPGLGGVSNGTTTSDTPEQAATRAAILAKISACPFLAAVPAQQAAYSAWVKSAPASSLVNILDLVNRLSLVPVEVPAAAGEGNRQQATGNRLQK